MSNAEDIEQIVVAAHALTRIAALETRNEAPAAQWRTLSILQTEGPRRLGELAAMSRVTQPGMTRLVGQLADAGLIARESDPADSRASIIKITDAGARAIAAWRVQLRDALEPHFADLDEDDWDAHRTHRPDPRRQDRPRVEVDPMTAAQSDTASVWKQPMRVWAVAFACVVAFMGIGLVDPILPVIAEQLQATPVQTELLFTSYLLVTGLAMLVTSWMSSRIGAKATLLIGLGLIVVFATLCALSGSVDAVIALPRRLGPRQRPVHLHRARDDRRCGDRRQRRGDHPLRGGARPRHRHRPAARRTARLGELARTLLRRRRAHGHRLRRHRRAAARTRARSARRCPCRRPFKALRTPALAVLADRRAVLQHRVLRAPRVLAVPAGLRRRWASA